MISVDFSMGILYSIWGFMNFCGLISINNTGLDDTFQSYIGFLS